MLHALRLENLAVVEEVTLEFGPGLTVLTGETGAGKSILVDALGLLLGGRGDAALVRAGADEAVVEGTFEATPAVVARLEALGLPHLGAELVVRRTVARSGRGRVHVNGALTSVGMLGSLLGAFADVAGQHEHVALFDERHHRALLDAWAGLEGEGTELAAYREAHAHLQALDHELQAEGGDGAQAQAQLDYLLHQLQELAALDPREGEEATLEAERRRLGAAERLREAALRIDALVAQDAGALELTGRAAAAAADAERVDAAFGPIGRAIAAAAAELDEAARAAGRYLAGLEADSGRLAEVDDRLDALRRLARKHRVPVDGLAERRRALEQDVARLQTRDERRATLEVALARAREQAWTRAAAVRARRLQAAADLKSAVQARLGELAMPRAVFDVAVGAGELSPFGADQVSFVFSANPGEPPRPLARVASGGEASRLLLALKASVAAADGGGVSVFDEADQGVGGAVADAVGRLLRQVSGHRQVLCVTHLPQVAAWADRHVVVTKRVAQGRTRTAVVPLASGDLRARELARMLSGAQVSREALGAAEALLRAARRPVRSTRARPAARRTGS